MRNRPSKRRIYGRCGGLAARGGSAIALPPVFGQHTSRSEHPASNLRDAEALSASEKTASTGETGKYRAERPKNIELPTVPIINLSMNDVAALNQGVLPDSGGHLKKTVVQRAQVRLGLNQHPAAYIPASNVLRNGEEFILKITKAGLNKMFSPADGVDVPVETLAVVENLEQIANNGVYFASEGDRKGREQILGIDHLMTTVYIDNVPYIVDMRVRVVQSGQSADQQNVLYYLTPEEIVTIKKVDGNTPAAGRPASDGGAPPSTVFTIAPSESGVKGQDMQRGLGVYASPGESIDSLIERMYNETEPDHFEPPAPPEEIPAADAEIIDREWGGGEALPESGIKIEMEIPPGANNLVPVYTDGYAQVNTGKVEVFPRGKVQVDVEGTTAHMQELERIQKETPGAYTDAMEKEKEACRKKLHNYVRSQEMKVTLEKAGIADTPEYNQQITRNLLEAAKQVKPDGLVVFSYIDGPSGRVEIESRWTITAEGKPYMTTIILRPVK